jgi:ABC-type phosphate transport system auxiliary subunit
LEKTINRLYDVEEKANQILMTVNEEKEKLKIHYQKKQKEFDEQIAQESKNKLNALKSQVEKEFLKEADHINQNFHKQLKTLEGKHKEEHDNLVEQIFFKITSEE